MEPITITIKPPITEYCGKCDYRASFSFHSCHVICPKCGQESVHSVYAPKRNSIYVVRSHGCYDILHPSSKDYNYTFQNLPEGLRRSYVVTDEIDHSDPLSCAEELKTLIDRYIYNQDKEKISALVDYLQEHKEEQCNLRLLEEKETLEFKLYKLLLKMPKTEETE